MTAIAAIGARDRVRGLALAGVEVLAAEDGPQVRAAWTALTPRAELVILTSDAHAALREQLSADRSVLVAVLP